MQTRVAHIHGQPRMDHFLSRTWPETEISTSPLEKNEGYLGLFIELVVCFAAATSKLGGILLHRLEAEWSPTRLSTAELTSTLKGIQAKIGAAETQQQKLEEQGKSKFEGYRNMPCLQFAETIECIKEMTTQFTSTRENMQSHKQAVRVACTNLKKDTA